MYIIDYITSRLLLIFPVMLQPYSWVVAVCNYIITENIFWHSGNSGPQSWAPECPNVKIYFIGYMRSIAIQGTALDYSWVSLAPHQRFAQRSRIYTVWLLMTAYSTELSFKARANHSTGWPYQSRKMGKQVGQVPPSSTILVFFKAEGNISVIFVC